MNHTLLKIRSKLPQLLFGLVLIMLCIFCTVSSYLDKAHYNTAPSTHTTQTSAIQPKWSYSLQHQLLISELQSGKNKDYHFSFRNKIKAKFSIRKAVAHISFDLKTSGVDINFHSFSSLPSTLTRPGYYIFLFRYTLF